MHENEPKFHRIIIMSDEAHFYLGGYINKQKCRIWGSENPTMIIKKPLYLQRVTVFKLNSNPYHYKLKFPLTSKRKFNSKFQGLES